MRRKEAMRINTPDDWQSFFFSKFLILFHFHRNFFAVLRHLSVFSLSIFTLFFIIILSLNTQDPHGKRLRKLRKFLLAGLKLLLWTCIWTKCRATNISISHYSFAVNWFKVVLKWWNRKLFVSHFIYVYTGQAIKKTTTVRPLRNRLDNWLLTNFNTE